MGPMWPMMNYSGGSLILALGVLLALMIVLIGLAIWRNTSTRAYRRPRLPEEILRERYAQGELSRQQYLEALVDMLKDRYVRGELELDEYEKRIDLLLREPAKERQRELK